jgi:hypothetical protein
MLYVKQTVSHVGVASGCPAVCIAASTLLSILRLRAVDLLVQLVREVNITILLYMYICKFT